MNQSTKLYWHDLIRGISAVLVLAGHLRSLLFINYNESDKTFFDAIFYFLTGLGHQSVIIFFVLSGFFIAKSCNKNNQFNFRTYIVNRVSRLWTVLIPALIFTYSIDRIGLIYFEENYIYNGSINELLININKSTNLQSFIGNIFYLQNVYVPSFGSNGPLWSLTNEFWYYILYGLILISVLPHSMTKHKLISISVIVLIFYILGYQILIYFPIWIMGALVHIISNKYQITKHNILILILLVLMISILSIYKMGYISSISSDYILATIFSLILIQINELNMKSTILKKIADYLSKISFTLYLFHLPITILMTSILVEKRTEFNFAGSLIYFFIMILIIIISTLMWNLFEKNTHHVRRKLNELIISNKE